MSASVPEKSILKSETTQRIVISGAAIVSVFAVVRQFAPSLLPWTAEHDMEFAGAVITLVTPLLSRLLAKWGWSVTKGGAA